MRPILVCSLGNPGAQYASTLHSAGHVLCTAIARHLGAPSPRKDAKYKGLVTDVRPGITLHQSIQYMNESGKSVGPAWRAFAAANPSSSYSSTDGPPQPTLSAAASQPRLDPLTAKPLPEKKPPRPLTTATATGPLLVVLHDELELPLGVAKISTGAGRSARGHNGLKSVLALPGMREEDFARVGVGIGPRPEGRGPDEVARFVLRAMGPGERAAVDGLADGVWAALERLADGQGVGKGGRVGVPVGRGR